MCDDGENVLWPVNGSDVQIGDDISNAGALDIGVAKVESGAISCSP